MTDCFNCYMENRNRTILDHTDGQLHACLKKASKYAFELQLAFVREKANAL